MRVSAVVAVGHKSNSVMLDVEVPGSMSWRPAGVFVAQAYRRGFIKRAAMHPVSALHARFPRRGRWQDRHQRGETRSSQTSLE